MCRLSDRRELMIGHPRVTSCPSERGRQKSRCRVHTYISASESRGRREKESNEAHRSHPRKLPRPPLMRGFGRHTSKVIAYLRDQVGPPRRVGPLISRYRIGTGWRGVSHGKKGNASSAFCEVIKTVVSATEPSLITSNYS